MARRIVVNPKCYMCEHRSGGKAIEKPGPFGSRFTDECDKCLSVNTYVASRKGNEIKIQTIYVSSSPRGRDFYKERTGEDFKVE